MKQINVVVVDGNFEYQRGLKKYFENHDFIKIIRSFTNGEDAVSYLIKEENTYDLIILDPIISGVDGETIMEELNHHNIKKRVIITANSICESIYEKQKDYNIIYFYQKPYTFPSLERRTRDYFQLKYLLNSSSKNIDLVITNVLHDLGIPSNLKGYDYLKEAILMKFNDKTITYVTKDIYPRIAKEFNTKPENVERNIRHAIEVSCIRGNYEFIHEIFRNTKNTEKEKPTNYEFISTITERLKIDCNLK